MTISEYLRNRGLSFDPVEIQKDIDPILSNDELVREAAELCESKGAIIALIVQARVNAIGKQILEKCTPEEVLVYRQSLVEVSAIMSDLNAYKAEYARRKASLVKEDEEEKTPEPPKEGKESSL